MIDLICIVLLLFCVYGIISLTYDSLVQPRIIEAKAKILKLYATEGGEAGGYGHVVFDDDNVSDSIIESCLKSAFESDDLRKELVANSVEALLSIRRVPKHLRSNLIKETLGY